MSSLYRVVSSRFVRVLYSSDLPYATATILVLCHFIASLSLLFCVTVGIDVVRSIDEESNQRNIFRLC